MQVLRGFFAVASALLVLVPGGCESSRPILTERSDIVIMDTVPVRISIFAPPSLSAGEMSLLYVSLDGPPPYNSGTAIELTYTGESYLVNPPSHTWIDEDQYTVVIPILTKVDIGGTDRTITVTAQALNKFGFDKGASTMGELVITP